MYVNMYHGRRQATTTKKGKRRIERSRFLAYFALAAAAASPSLVQTVRKRKMPRLRSQQSSDSSSSCRCTVIVLRSTNKTYYYKSRFHFPPKPTWLSPLLRITNLLRVHTAKLALFSHRFSPMPHAMRTTFNSHLCPSLRGLLFLSGSGYE